MSDVKIKELDKSLIHQANSNSMGGQRGDISAHEYEVYCQKVMSWNIRASVAAMNASIKAIELKFGTNVTKNPFSATFGSLDGLTVTGAWNAEQARVEF